jgi:hypothetical protein
MSRDDLTPENVRAVLGLMGVVGVALIVILWLVRPL